MSRCEKDRPGVDGCGGTGRKGPVWRRETEPGWWWWSCFDENKRNSEEWRVT